MKIKRDIKHPEWVERTSYRGLKTYKAQIGPIQFEISMSLNGDWMWDIFVENNFEEPDRIYLSDGNVKGAIEEAKAAAFEAYLNLIFH